MFTVMTMLKSCHGTRQGYSLLVSNELAADDPVSRAKQLT